MDQLILEDLSSIESPASFLTQQMDTIDLSDTEYEKLEKQVEELTKQLNESMKKFF
jgi:prefoldin subunit 5